MDRISDIPVKEKISCCNHHILELEVCQSKPTMTDERKTYISQFLL
jgi:hypothetical protein